MLESRIVSIGSTTDYSKWKPNIAVDSQNINTKLIDLFTLNGSIEDLIPHAFKVTCYLWPWAQTNRKL